MKKRAMACANGVPFGQEKTEQEHRERAAWDTEQAAQLRAAARPVGWQALVDGHEHTAREYTRRANEIAHSNETVRAAHAAFARLMRGDFAVLHVYYRPRQFEAFAEGEVPPGAGWTRAFPERVPSDRTADQLVAWFAARTGRVPYLT